MGGEVLRGKGCWLTQGKQGGEKHSLPSPLNCCIFYCVISQGLKCMRRATLLALLESGNGACQTVGSKQRIAWKNMFFYSNPSLWTQKWAACRFTLKLSAVFKRKVSFCHSFFILFIIYLIKSSDIVLVELFQILKDDAVKVLHSICQQIWKTQQWPQDWKRSVSFQSQGKAMPKNAQTTTQLHSSHMLVK